MLETSASVARFNQRLRRIEPNVQDDTTREIPLTKGKVALVDAKDFERVSAVKWHAHRSNPAGRAKWYARRLVSTPQADGATRQVPVLLHRFIMDAPPDKQVDHRDGDGLNCRRLNMRIATRTQNARNCKPCGTSGYKGVSKSGGGVQNPYRAQIKISGVTRLLGFFPDAVSAAHAYDQAATKLFGEFAWLNFPKESAANG